MSDLIYKTSEEKDLKEKILAYKKIGGYSANNFSITTSNHNHFFLKEFTKSDPSKLDFLMQISNTLTKNKKILYHPAFISKSTYQIFPWIEGSVLRGKEIKKGLYKDVIARSPILQRWR